MHPVLFEVFGRPISGYGVCIVIGALAAWFLSNALVRRCVCSVADKRTAEIFRENVWMAFLICVCGGIVGAVLFRPITRIPELIINFRVFREVPIGVIMDYLFGEIVFYGGFIGGAAALYIFCRWYRIGVLPIADILAPSVALAHAFGRVGCFFGGCCYGVPVAGTHPFAVRFPAHTAGGAVSGVPVLATQLIEAACLLIIAALLTALYLRSVQLKNERKAALATGMIACLYGFLYSVLRFVLEFFRGDLVRGVYGPFSTSQYVSIALFAASALLMRRIAAKNPAA